MNAYVSFVITGTTTAPPMPAVPPTARLPLMKSTSVFDSAATCTLPSAETVAPA